MCLLPKNTLVLVCLLLTVWGAVKAKVISHVKWQPHGYLFDDCDLTEVSSRSTLYQRDVCRQAHPIHMITSSYGNKNVLFSSFLYVGFFKITFLSSEVKFEYLCYLKHSSPAQTSWRTPHCSPDCQEKDTMTFQLNRLSKIIQYKDKVFYFKYPWSYWQLKKNKNLWVIHLKGW